MLVVEDDILERPLVLHKIALSIGGTAHVAAPERRHAVRKQPLIFLLFSLPAGPLSLLITCDLLPIGQHGDFLVESCSICHEFSTDNL
jgi:hypothetical protein